MRKPALILANIDANRFPARPRNYDRVWIRDGSSQALACSGQVNREPAKAFVLWYSKRIYKNQAWFRRFLDVDGKPYKGFGGDLEFDAQGQFVWIAAEVYRITRDRAFLKSILEPVVRATTIHRGAFRGNRCAAWGGQAVPRPPVSFHQPRGLQHAHLQLLGRFLRLERLAGLPLSGFGGR